MSHYRDVFEAFAKERGGDAPRERAFARFAELGFPTVKQEDWRFTNLAPLAASEFALGRPTSNGSSGIRVTDIERLGFANSMVFVDGHYRADLSSATVGVNVAGRGNHIEEELDDTAPALLALNRAFTEDGAYVEIEGELEAPLHVLFIGTDGTASHPRNLYHVKEGGRAEIIESWVSLGAEAHWTNAATVARVAQNAELHLTRLQLENEAAFHTSHTWVSQARDSRFTSNVITLGGGLVRNDTTAALNAENCICTLNGLFLTHGTQHVDNHTWVEHRKPFCESHELYKGILDDKSSGVFSGYIHVFEDAQKTDAYQSSKTLLLSDSAKVDSQPQLEIYADDVKCSHGSTTGQIDKDALFYMGSRGIRKSQARNMLIRAFARDVTDRLAEAAVRDRIDVLITQRLPA